MSVFKGLMLSLLSFLLFLSLSLFGLAFMAQQTALNPDFVVAEVNRLDFTELAEEMIETQTAGGETTGAMDTIYTGVISDLEPLVKEQLSTVIYSTYDYLLGKKPDPELRLALRETFLGEDFLVAVIDKLDIASLLSASLKEQLTSNLPGELASLSAQLETSIDEAVNELKPWLKEEARAAAEPLADYLLGDSPDLEVVISLEPVKEVVRDKLLTAFLASPPPEVAAMPPAMLEVAFNISWAIFSPAIPDSYPIDESVFESDDPTQADIPTQIATALTETEAALLQARLYIGYFQLAYRVLIGLIVLFVAASILVSRDIKAISRQLGISCLLYGVLEYAGIYVAKIYAAAEIVRQPDIPPGMQTWFTRFIDNLMAPLVTFSLALVIAGAVLIIISVVYRRRYD